MCPNYLTRAEGRRRDASAAGGSLAQALLDVPRAGDRFVIFSSNHFDFDITNRAFSELAARALLALRQSPRRRVVLARLHHREPKVCQALQALYQRQSAKLDVIQKVADSGKDVGDDLKNQRELVAHLGKTVFEYGDSTNIDRFRYLALARLEAGAEKLQNEYQLYLRAIVAKLPGQKAPVVCPSDSESWSNVARKQNHVH